MMSQSCLNVRVRAVLSTSLLLMAGGLVQTGWAAALQNGGMETNTTGVAQSWTSYNEGVLAWAYSKATPGADGTGANQFVDSPSAGANNAQYAGIYQTVDAAAGDAFTFTARAKCASNSNNALVTIRADWAGGTARPTSYLASAGQSAATWTTAGAFKGSGNATGSSVTLFLDVTSAKTSKVGADTNWDDAIAYRAWVPPAPALGNATTNSISVNVNPGGNSDNTAAQYAISIGGGGYTIGTNWVNASGNVVSSALWQDDATWATRTINSLLPNTAYTVEIMARYSSTVTQATILQGAANQSVLWTLPEPATLVLLTLGGLVFRRRR